MFETILNWFGFKYIYIDKRGIFTHRYDGTDLTCGRPIHENMSVAYPTAYKAIVKKSFKVSPFSDKNKLKTFNECVDNIDKVIKKYKLSDTPTVYYQALLDIEGYLLVMKITNALDDSKDK